MPTFKLPTFPLFCNIFQGQGGGPAVPTGATQANVSCQLRMPRGFPTLVTTSSGSVIPMSLLVAKLTDIRPQHASTNNSDAVEVPAGSGRFYAVIAVDDVAKGFTNEYRKAIIRGNPQFAGWWPFPTP